MWRSEKPEEGRAARRRAGCGCGGVSCRSCAAAVVRMRSWVADGDAAVGPEKRRGERRGVAAEGGRGAQQQQVARPLHFGEHATANAQFILPGQLEARPNNSPQHFVHPNMHVGEDNAALSTPCVSSFSQFPLRSQGAPSGLGLGNPHHRGRSAVPQGFGRGLHGKGKGFPANIGKGHTTVGRFTSPGVGSWM